MVDPTAGARQTFISDCEICCRAIQLAATIDRDGAIELQARREDD